MWNIDLYSSRFWLFVGLAVAIMVPLREPRLRKYALASLNLGFLAIHLTFLWMLVAFGLLLACWAVLGLFGSGRARTMSVVVGSSVLLFLFILHKLPLFLNVSGISGFRGMLAAVGFSYVALRLYEVGDAIRLGRHACPDFASMVNYVVPFHMLAAGPIQAYDEFVSQPAVPPPSSFGQSLKAIERIATGLFKKYILANLVEKLLLTGYHAGGPYLLLEIQFHYLWLYLDFSAYSDVAVGIGGLIGVSTPENFNRPYLARNLFVFWERWHISFSKFVLRNMFVPIQVGLMRRWDSRLSMLAASLAFTVSFVLCGLWHNISPRWAAWGLFESGGMIVCGYYKQFLIKRLGRKGFHRYLANPGVHALAVAITFEFAAVAVMIQTYPFEDLTTWMQRSRPSTH